uniref:UvrD-like helicase, ATP-binding domain, P-loop containing nucleoside triphosphate hydrolase n=1 Tax=Tanacetum cinerariifolium TaxID=118510 RepID=A0A699KF20_TANCI|nr:UvrD-like helicase, ATP-binding domain, P-loop containing nucleoside triphosphate hydrolase [Tanacetum cinerariifolium]
MWTLFVGKLRDVGFKEDLVLPEDDTLRWGKLSTDDCSYYHKVLALKLVMMLALILLEESNYSQVLLALLTSSNNIADLLPQKFVSSLLRRRNGRSLNLDSEVVAGVFMSVKDPLMIVLSTLNSYNVVVGMILELPSHVSVNRNVNPVTECKGALQMKLKVLKEIYEFITKNKGILPCIYSMESIMTTDLDQKICALATALEEEKLCTGEDMILALSEFSKLKVLLELSLQETEHSGFMKNLDGILEWLNTSRPMVDDFLKHYGRNLWLGKW